MLSRYETKIVLFSSKPSRTRTSLSSGIQNLQQNQYDKLWWVPRRILQRKHSPKNGPFVHSLLFSNYCYFWYDHLLHFNDTRSVVQLFYHFKLLVPSVASTEMFRTNELNQAIVAVRMFFFAYFEVMNCLKLENLQDNKRINQTLVPEIIIWFCPKASTLL